MPIRRSPNGAHHPHPQAGRDRPEWVVAINRNAWSQSIGIAGRDHPVCARSDALVCLASLNINQARRNTMNNDDRLKNVERDGSDQVPALSRPFRNLRSPLLNGECSGACAWICSPRLEG